MVWYTDYPECVGHYSITLLDLTTPAVQKTEHISSRNSTNHEWDSLIPCTDYEVLIKTFSLDNRLTSQVKVRERTTLANLVVEEFKVARSGLTWVKLQWTRLREVERCEGDYFVKMYMIGETYPIVIEIHIPYTDNELNIRDLRACRRYNVSLHANYFDIVGSLNFDMAYQTPSDPHGLSYDWKSLNLSWISPIENMDCVDHYSIRISNVGEYPTRSNSMNLGQLERCYEHQIFLNAVDATGKVGKTLNVNATLTYDVLDFPIELVLDINNQTLLIKWLHPKYRRHCEISAELKWNSIVTLPVAVTESSHSYMINEFEFCANHTIDFLIHYQNTTKILRKNVFYPGSSKIHLREL